LEKLTSWQIAPTVWPKDNQAACFKGLDCWATSLL
jgi:hypothetical protein